MKVGVDICPIQYPDFIVVFEISSQWADRLFNGTLSLVFLNPLQESKKGYQLRQLLEYKTWVAGCDDGH